MNISKIIIKDKKDLFLITFFMLLATFLAQGVPYLIKFLSDNVSKMNLLNVVIIAILLVGIGIIRYFSDYFADRFYFKFTDTLGFILLDDFIRSIITSKKSLLLKFNPDILNRIALSDIEQLKKSILTQYFKAINTVLQIITLILFVIILDWKLGLITILWYGIFFFSTNHLLKRITKHKARERANYSNILTFIKDSIYGNFDIKHYANYTEYMNRFRKINEKYITSSVDAQSSYSLFNYLTYIGNFMNIAIIIIYKALIPHEISTGTLLAMYMYTISYSNIFSSIMYIFSNRKQISVLKKPIESFYEIAKKEVNNGIELEENITEIDIDNLTVEYEGKRIIDNVSIHLKKGYVYFINGKSGAGKTSLINAIIGEINYSGTVKYNDHDIKLITPALLYSQLGIIKQNIFLFNTSIYNNITLFNDSYSEAEVIKNANIVGISDVYHEIGTSELDKVSGGERKRIAIARLLMCIQNKNVIVLDETFANIDMDTIKKLSNEILKLTRDKILIIITHDNNIKKLFLNEKIININLDNPYPSGNPASKLLS